MSRRMFLPPVALKQLSEFLELRLEESVGFFYITGGRSEVICLLTGLVFVNLELFEKCEE